MSPWSAPGTAPASRHSGLERPELPSHLTLMATPTVPSDGGATVTTPAPPVLSTAMVCTIESAVSDPPNPRVRSAAIVAIVEEIHRALTSSRGGETGHAELVSLSRIVAEATAHQARMVEFQGGARWQPGRGAPRAALSAVPQGRTPDLSAPRPCPVGGAGRGSQPVMIA